MTRTFKIRRRQETLTDYLIEVEDDDNGEDACHQFAELLPEEVVRLPKNVVYSYDGVDEAEIMTEVELTQPPWS